MPMIVNQVPTDGKLVPFLVGVTALLIVGVGATGGISNLLVIGGRVRFEITLGRARLAGLRIDSQLLRLATKAYGGRL